MFVRVATSPLSSALQYAKDERYREAERLYQESIRCAYAHTHTHESERDYRS